MARLQTAVLSLGLLALSSNLYAQTTPPGKLPYYCSGLKLDEAIGVLKGSNLRAYKFTGICKVRESKEPLKYRDFWVKVVGTWDVKTQSAVETTKVIAGARGALKITMKCTEDPWLSNGLCLVQSYDNTTGFDALAIKFDKNPPLARGITNASWAGYLSAVYDAKQKGLPLPPKPTQPTPKQAAKPTASAPESEPTTNTVEPETPTTVPTEAPKAEPQPAPAPKAQAKPTPAPTKPAKKKQRYVPILERVNP